MNFIIRESKRKALEIVARKINGKRGGGEGGGSAYICLNNSKAISIFQLNSLQMTKGFSCCLSQRCGLWKYRGSTKSIYSPSTSLTLFLGLGREGRATASLIMAVLIWAGRKAGEVFEHVLPLIGRRVLCERAKDLMSQLENRCRYLGDVNTRLPLVSS